MLSLTERDLVASSAPDDPRPLFVRPVHSRRWAPGGAATIVSVVVHVALASVLLVSSNPQRPHIARPFRATPRLVSVVYIPTMPLDLPKLDLPKLSAPVEVPVPEPKPEPPREVPLKPVEIAAIETPVPQPVPAVAEAPRTPPPAPPPPKPTVGLFPEATAATRSPEPARRVESAGFDAPVKETAESKLGQATVGAFDSAPQAGTRQRGSAVVADSGFGRTASASTSSQPTRTVRETDFGDSASRERLKAAEPPAEVKQAGFASVAAEAPKRVAAAPARPVVTPVEVLSKPTPIYTEQARQLKIEGTVVLEVEFSASGSLRILRVVRGLGYGLDEAAISAAKQMRFKPAQDGERAVDFRTTVQIVFRLA